MTNLFNYIDRPSPIHRLTGACKLVCLILWTLAAMTSFYTPLLIAMTIGALALFRTAKLKVSDISFMLGIMGVYVVLNNILIFLFSPCTAPSFTAARRCCSTSPDPTPSRRSSFSTI